MSVCVGVLFCWCERKPSYEISCGDLRSDMCSSVLCWCCWWFWCCCWRRGCCWGCGGRSGAAAAAAGAAAGAAGAAAAAAAAGAGGVEVQMVVLVLRRLLIHTVKLKVLLRIGSGS